MFNIFIGVLVFLLLIFIAVFVLFVIYLIHVFNKKPPSPIVQLPTCTNNVNLTLITNLNGQSLCTSSEYAGYYSVEYPIGSGNYYIVNTQTNLYISVCSQLCSSITTNSNNTYTCNDSNQNNVNQFNNCVNYLYTPTVCVGPLPIAYYGQTLYYAYAPNGNTSSC